MAKRDNLTTKHNHHHHHHNTVVTNLNKAFKLGITLNIIYVLVEAAFGFYYDSMGLLSDAGHKLSDVATLAIAMFAFKMAQHPTNERYTYGYQKMTIQASLINAVLLLIAVGAILVESISKLIHPEVVDGSAIAWVAGIGIVVNGVTAWLFMREKDKDLNVKGAFLHMAADALTCIGVVASGIIIHFTGWYIIDPIIGICIAGVVGSSAVSLLRDSMRLTLDAVPKGIDYDQVKDAISKVDGVLSVRSLHIWALSTTTTAMTTQVIVDKPDEIDMVINNIRHKTHHIGIDYSTIEAQSQPNYDLE